jgi:acyl-CoA thioester hydrolase
MVNIITKKIYYHDTDAGGVVYYANYLKFFEEGRTQYFEDKGIFTEELLKQNIAFVVAKANVEYKKPLRYMDSAKIITDVKNSGNFSIVFLQKVMKNDDLCCVAEITVVCVNDKMKPVKIPEKVKQAIRR